MKVFACIIYYNGFNRYEFGVEVDIIAWHDNIKNDTVKYQTIKEKYYGYYSSNKRKAFDKFF